MGAVAEEVAWRTLAALLQVVGIGLGDFAGMMIAPGRELCGGVRQIVRPVFYARDLFTQPSGACGVRAFQEILVAVLQAQVCCASPCISSGLAGNDRHAELL
jgi:hypothetical protein